MARRPDDSHSRWVLTAVAAALLALAGAAPTYYARTLQQDTESKLEKQLQAVNTRLVELDSRQALSRQEIATSLLQKQLEDQGRINQALDGIRRDVGELKPILASIQARLNIVENGNGRPTHR